jgi:hypothetical protein
LVDRRGHRLAVAETEQGARGCGPRAMEFDRNEEKRRRAYHRYYVRRCKREEAEAERKEGRGGYD